MNKFSNNNATIDPGLDDRYFGGRLVFQTKIVWVNVTFFGVLHLLGLYGLYLCFLYALQLRFGPFLFNNSQNTMNEIPNNNATIDTGLEDRYFGGRLVFRTKIVWVNVTFFAVLHLLGLYGLYLCFLYALQLRFGPFLFSYFVAFLGGQGITVGAHRLWTHRSYKANWKLRSLLCFIQTTSGQNCIHTWVLDHRQHHKYADTDADPHNAKRGLFYSHVGWLMMKKHPDCKATRRSIYMSDIEQDPFAMFQKRHYKKLYIVAGMILPVIIGCYVFNESIWHSIAINIFWRQILLYNSTWTVNSLAHKHGMKPYDESILSTENSFVSLISYGEGWHNYHHIFPWDYKTSEYGMKLNVSRDVIEFFEKLGWAYDLKEASADMVQKRIYRTGKKGYIAKARSKSNVKHLKPTEEDHKFGF